MKTLKNVQYEVLFQKAWENWIHGYESEAAEIWKQILISTSNENDKLIEIDVINYLAMYQRVWEEKIEQVIDLKKYLDIANDLKYTRGIANISIELALRSKTFERTQELFIEARRLYEEINDRNGIMKALFLYSTYLIERGVEKFDYIFKQLQTALELAIGENNKFFIAQIHYAIGEAFLRLGNLHEAHHHFEISLQNFTHLGHERRSISLLVSIADVKIQSNLENAIDELKNSYTAFTKKLENIREKIPVFDLFYHLSRFSDLFLELEDFKQVQNLINDLEKILRQVNIESSLYFQGKMALAHIKGNLELTKLNLSNASEMYNYILRRRDHARISDLYGALISLAVISLYKYRIIFDGTFIKNAQDLVQEAIKISEATDHIKGYVRAHMVFSLLKLSIAGVNADLSEMEDVIILAQEKGLHSEAKKAYQELSRFKGIYQSQTQFFPEAHSVAEVLQYALEAKKSVKKIN